MLAKILENTYCMAPLFGRQLQSAQILFDMETMLFVLSVEESSGLQTVAVQMRRDLIFAA